MRVEDLSTYEIIEKRQIPDINSVTYLCRHKKTGARVALVSNDDENKVFYIGFRTTPKDSTGVAHILEHSVLCGSKEFPVKDPFVELHDHLVILNHVKEGHNKLVILHCDNIIKIFLYVWENI